ncbi:hypothetical protein BRD56_07855 [Thermoplasmatales archaeon SW_10_69_26]|nr:MAG: hypothetical protein BRD56_07855 [Thermoplasmatales archaeon SW_10_69_26]
MVSVPARRLLLVVAVLLVVVPAVDAVRVLDSPGQLPDRVHGYGTAQIDDESYLVGGGRGQGYIDEITLLRADGTADTVASLPTALKSPAAAAHEGQVYVFGGAQASASDDLPETTSAIHRFDPQTGEATRITGVSLPDPVAAASAVTIDDRIYVLGGLSIQPNEDPQVDFHPWVAAFDPEQETITQLDAELPTGRAQASALAVDGEIVYLGGHAEAGEDTCPGQASTCFVPDVLTLDPEADTLTKIGELDEPLRWTAAIEHEGTAYVLGGCSANCDPHRGSAAIQTVDPATGETATLPVTMPLTGGRNGAFLHGDEAWVPGGVRATQNGTEDHATVLRVELGPTRSWAPTNLSAEAVPGGIRLDWEPPEYDGGSPVEGYIVERSRGAREPVRLDAVSDTRFRDTNASQGTTYTYQIRAENPHGVSAPSGGVDVRATQTPQAPAVTAQGGDGKLVVQWSPPDDTGGLDIESYRVFAYAPDSDADLERCASACWGTVSESATRASITSVQDEPVENGATYEIRVQARNGNGWGQPSDPQQVQPRPVPEAPTELTARADEGSGQVELGWQPPAEDVDGYAVYRGPALDELELLTRSSDTEHTDGDGVPRGQTVVYAVAARNGDAESPLGQPARAVFATPPGEVADLSARWTGSHVHVSWSPPNETGGEPLQAYEVARTRGAMDPEEADAEIQRTAVERYRDSNPPRGKPVSYHVRAVTDAGEGPWEFRQVRVPLTQDSRPPVPALAAHPGQVDVGGRVVFDASGSQDDEGIVAYNFTFGDGDGTGWRSSPRVTYNYEEQGVYEATVTVRDASGLQAASQATIAVGPPEDDGSQEPVGGDVNQTVGETDDAPIPALAALLGLAAAARLARRS